jgi:hypothetical protein
MNSARIAIALLLFYSGPLFAKAPAAFHYLAPDSLDVKSLLSGPPAPDSPENRADIQAVLSRQKTRTPADIARARSEETLSPAAFADVLGTGFTPDKFPLTFALLNDATTDADSISSAAKQLWHRPRPPLQDHDIHPVVPVPANASYPSGHATRGALWSIILAQLAPELKDRLLARGAQIGQDRIVGGVHFPTDVAAGQKLGRALAKRFLENPKFQTDLERAEAEFASVRPNSAASSELPPFPSYTGTTRYPNWLKYHHTTHAGFAPAVPHPSPREDGPGRMGSTLDT